MNKCAIIIPVHKEITDKQDHYLLSRSLKVFSKRDIYFIAPSQLKAYVDTLQKDYHSTNVKFFKDSYFKNVKQYSRLLTSDIFYREFLNYSHVCICQLDVLSLRDELDYWMDQPWDYIGAPMFEGYGKTNSRQFVSTLNGGFSLRKVDSSLRVLNTVKIRYCRVKDLYSMENNIYLKCVRIIRDGLIFNYNIPFFRMLLNEDLYWTYIAPRTHSWFKTPGPDIARKFAFDKHPTWLYELNGKQLPLAIHAWNRFEPEFAEKILTNSLPTS